MEAPEAIVANATYHTNLLNTIAELEYVPSAKRHQVTYIKDLEGQLSKIKKKVALLAETTKKERAEHETLRDSTGRRFAYKVMGKREKYEAKESKEEREYVEALEREMTERDNQNVIAQLLDDAQIALKNLNQKGEKYESAKLELAALYARVFDGPTQVFPEDDRLEYQLDETTRKYDQVQASVNSENRAAELLARAAKAMDACQRNMQEALSYSRYDMWGGGSMADMMERSALRNAQVNASQVEMLVAQAQRESPNVQPVGQVNIARGSIMTDVFFDNIFSDMAFHNKIKQSAAQVLLANSRLKAELNAAKRRTDAAGQNLIEIAGLLDDRRRELDDFRRATFESYAAQNPPPPDYDAIPQSAPAAPLSSPSRNSSLETSSLGKPPTDKGPSSQSSDLLWEVGTRSQWP